MENKIERLTVEAVELLKEMISIPSPSFEEDAVCGYVCSIKSIIGRRTASDIFALLGRTKLSRNSKKNQ